MIYKWAVSLRGNITRDVKNGSMEAVSKAAVEHACAVRFPSYRVHSIVQKEKLLTDDMPIVLVCGGREYDNRACLKATLDTAHFCGKFALLQGGNKGKNGKPGADLMAQEWAVARRVPNFELPADWDYFKRAAGAIRNGLMLKLFEPSYVMAVPGGPGTKDMMTQADAAKVPVLKID